MISFRYLSIEKLVYNLYFLLVFFVFLSTVDIIPPSVYYLSSCATILLCLIIFFLSIYNKFVDGNDILRWMIFILPILVSCIFNLNNTPNISRVLLLIVFYPLFFISLNFIVFRCDIRNVLKPLLIVIGTICILSTLSSMGLIVFNYYSTNENTLDYYTDVYSRDRLLAINGVYLNQNSFASILLVGFFLFLAGFFAFDKKLWKIVNIFFIILISCLLFLTLARGPIFSLLVGILVFLVFSKIKFILKVILLIILSFCLLLFVLSSEYWILFVDKLNSAGLSYRDVIWADVFNKINDNFLFGVGLGNYQFLDGYHAYSTHNLYLFFMVSLGAVGVSTLILLILIFIKKLFEIICNKYNDTIMLVFCCGLISIFIHQLFEVELDNPLKPFSFSFLLLFAYLYSAKIKSNR